MPTGTCALAWLSQLSLLGKHNALVPSREGSTVKQTYVPRSNNATNSIVACVNQAKHESQSKQDNHDNNGGTLMAAAKPRRKSIGAPGKQTLTVGNITKYNGNEIHHTIYVEEGPI